MLLSTDLTELPNAVRKRMHEILTQENAMAAVQAKIRQKQIAKFYHDNRPRSIDGIGGQVMAMDPYWLNYFRWQLGCESYHQDSDIKKWILKRHPEFRVRATGTKIQVGFERSEHRYTKRYPTTQPATRNTLTAP